MARWVVIALSVFMAINFADRAVLGFAALPIMHEFGLTATQFGAIGSLFSVLFPISAASVGWLSDRVHPNRILAGMAFVWGLAQLAVLASTGVGALIAARFFLGAAEGGAAPVALNAAFREIPSNQRPLVNAIILSGAPIGTALAALACTGMIAAWGWRDAFGVLGGVSAAWSIAWLVLRRNTSASAENARERSPRVTLPWRQFIASPTIAGVTALLFVGQAVIAVAFVWLPAFFQQSVGLTPAAAGLAVFSMWPLQLVFFLAAPLWMTYSKRGRMLQSRAVGWFATSAAMLGGCALMILPIASGAPAAIFAATIGLSAMAAVASTPAPIVAAIVPAANRGAVTGSILAVAMLGGIMGPVVFGYLLGTAAHPRAGYALAFECLGALILAVALGTSFLIRPATDRLLHLHPEVHPAPAPV